MLKGGAALAVVVCASGCGRLGFDGPSPTSDCAEIPFSTPVEVPGANTSGWEFAPGMTGDRLELYYHAGDREDVIGSDDLYMASRPDVASPFGAPVHLAGISTVSAEGAASLSPDGLALYFSSDRGAGAGGADIWMTTRTDRVSPWGSPVRVSGDVNTAYREIQPEISGDGLTLWFSSDRPGGAGGQDLWVATRPDTRSEFGAAVNVAEVNGASDYRGGVMTDDRLVLVFATDGANGSSDIYIASREDAAMPFSPPVPLAEVNSPDPDYGPWISPRGDELYFTSQRQGGTGGSDFWVATRSCP